MHLPPPGSSLLARLHREAHRRRYLYALALCASLSLFMSYEELRDASDDSAFLRSDSWDYLSIAQNLNAGNGYKITHGTTFVSQSETSYRTPGYPYFILACMKLFGTGKAVTAVVLYQHLLLALVPALFFAICRSFVKEESVALLAGVLSLMFRPLRALATLIHPEFLAIGALLAALWCLLSYVEKTRPSRLLLFSVFLAAAILLKQTLIVLALLWVFPLPRLARRKEYLASLAVVVFVVSAWVARNYAVQGRFPIFTTNGGINFYLGNHPGMQVDSSNKGQYDGIMNQLMAEGLSESQADRRLYELGWSQAVKNGPGWQVARVAGKAAVMVRDYFPDVRNEIFYLLLPFGLACAPRKRLLGILLGFQAVHGLWSWQVSTGLTGLAYWNSMDVTALHFVGLLSLLLLARLGGAKMHLLLTAYVLIQAVGLVYIPTDRETVIADSILILAYAASPLVLMGMLRPDGGTSRPWEESPRQATGIPSVGAQTPRPEAETQGP